MYFKGLGGGFMERDEIVEYKERTEDDDEYDEVKELETWGGGGCHVLCMHKVLC